MHPFQIVWCKHECARRTAIATLLDKIGILSQLVTTGRVKQLSSLLRFHLGDQTHQQNDLQLFRGKYTLRHDSTLKPTYLNNVTRLACTPTCIRRLETGGIFSKRKILDEWRDIYSIHGTTIFGSNFDS